MSEASPLQSPSTATITGHVYSSSGALLNGASVTCNDFITKTLADGAYRFSNLSSNTYTLTVTLKGYQPATQTIIIPETTAHTIDFHLTPATGTARVSGRVYDQETQRPLTTGTVILILPISNRYYTLGKKGSYTFINLAAGTYKLVASIPAYHDCEHIVVLADGESTVQDIYCSQNREVEPAWG